MWAAMNAHHLLSSKFGGGVAIIQIALCIQITRMLQAAGLTIKREIPIPEFSSLETELPEYADDDIDPREISHSRDANMDVVAFTPFGEEYLVDASVYKPLATRLCCGEW